LKVKVFEMEYDLFDPIHWCSLQSCDHGMLRPSRSQNLESIHTILHVLSIHIQFLTVSECAILLHLAARQYSTPGPEFFRITLLLLWPISKYLLTRNYFYFVRNDHFEKGLTDRGWLGEIEILPKTIEGRDWKQPNQEKRDKWKAEGHEELLNRNARSNNGSSRGSRNQKEVVRFHPWSIFLIFTQFPSILLAFRFPSIFSSNSNSEEIWSNVHFIWIYFKMEDHHLLSNYRSFSVH
jgi:hypothetical protein